MRSIWRLATLRGGLDVEDAAQLRDGPRKAAVDANGAKRPVLSHRPETQGLLSAIQVERGFRSRQVRAGFALQRRSDGVCCHFVALRLVEMARMVPASGWGDKSRINR